MTVPKSPFANYLLQKYRDWQVKRIQEGGNRVSLTAFAEYLEITQPTLSGWMNGNFLPSLENTNALATKLGSEVYNALGIETPDPLLTAFEGIYTQLTDQQKHTLLEQAEQYLTKNQQTNNRPITPSNEFGQSLNQPSP